MLFAVPVPEEYAMDEEEMNAIIDEALERAQKNNISGKHVTPYLLNHVVEVTKGKSLETSIL